ncbi:spore maturation protein CgeB [Arthrobacter oryzae]|uniref:Spore maturation protein CgeB n=1 Tax=Arthrobacter oryzae TaxID=409290 RepID=A0A495EPW1_9MICC|nr:glycosyltransferase [Arthrobacter oryzae]RKR18681.1 spore maturation protein CgeB [Arthrobacter oryzae]
MSVRQVRSAIWHFRHGGLIQLRQWRLRRLAEAGQHIPANIKGAEGGWKGRGKRRQLSFVPFESPAAKPRRSDLCVGVILDDFSSAAFGFEWNAVPLSRAGWRDQLKTSRVDFVFIESAWNGNGGEWQHQLTGASGPKPEFLALMEWCRESGIPTAFWNKEDPPHYEDFLPAARLFDAVFTSDSHKVPDYIAELGHERVSVLPFAAQPALHNPIRPGHGFQSRGVAFAGMYFAHKYPERRDQLDMLLGGASDAAEKDGFELEIFSRQLGGDSNYQFPEPLSQRVVGSLTYAQMLTAYRSYRVFLNVNSVIDSPSMCARRIFEITASGTPVVSSASKAIANYFPPDEVLVATSRSESAAQIRSLVANADYRDRVVHKAQRRIWEAHTYAHRAEKIVAAVLPGREQIPALPTVSAIVSTFRPHQLEHVFETLGTQRGVDLELVLLTHGFEVAEEVLSQLATRHGVRRYRFLTAGMELTLGECLNLCVAASTGEVLSKFDDDDFYGPDYLLDMLNALEFSQAAVVGKQAHYMHFLANEATILRSGHKEHRFSRLVAGPTITAARSVFESHPFEARSRGEDTRFLESVAQGGGAIYSADRFNYCQMRRGTGHTWDIADEELLASGPIKLFGNPIENITI